MAYATEVDRRRKSSGSTTPDGFNKDEESPRSKRPPSRSSPTTGSTGSYDHMSALSMKFKRAPAFRDGLPQRHLVPSKPSTMSRLAASSIPHDHDLLDRRQQLPGENLPEHHFKKRYFAAQKDLDDIPTTKKPENLVVKKRPSMLGGHRSGSTSKDEPDDDIVNSSRVENESSSS